MLIWLEDFQLAVYIATEITTILDLLSVCAVIMLMLSLYFMPIPTPPTNLTLSTTKFELYILSELNF